MKRTYRLAAGQVVFPGLGDKVRVFLILCCAFASGWTDAQSSAGTPLPLPQYPAGSISSAAQADQALLDAKRARVEQEKLFDSRRKVCYQKLLAEQCLAPEREDNNLAVRKIRAVEVEARAFNRNEAARETAARRNAQNAQTAAGKLRRESEQAQHSAELKKKAVRHDQAAREFESSAPKREQRAKESENRVRERREAQLKKAAEEKARSAERLERVRAHEKKVADVLRRAKEKDEKAREKAVKPAQGPATPAGRS